MREPALTLLLLAIACMNFRECVCEARIRIVTRSILSILEDFEGRGLFVRIGRGW